MKYFRVKQTTQFIVGPAGETDTQIVKYMAGLYDRLNLNRIYYSAYQKGLGDKSIAGEQTNPTAPTDIFTREHRLYQVDFLLRRYGFTESDIMYDRTGNLSLTTDPKEVWATMHPERFPIQANRASKHELLRVPGLGPVTVNRILKRRQSARLTAIQDIGKPGVLLKKAQKYLTF